MSQLKPLTDEERNILLPKLIKVLKKTSKEKTLYAPEIIIGFNKHMKDWGFKSKFCPARLRKLINHIRLRGLLPVISGPTGYYVTNDRDEIIAMAKSLEERAQSILSGAKGLRDYAQDIKQQPKKDPNDLFDMLDDRFLGGEPYYKKLEKKRKK